MKKILIIVLIFILLIFGGCSSGGIYDDSKKTDKTGYGLEVNFKIYDRDNLLKNRHQLFYELKLKNSGLKPVELSQDSLKLTTKQVSSSSGYLEDVFTLESLDEFYKKVFSDATLILYNDQEKIVSGILKIEDEFYNNPNNEQMDYQLDISYEYETVFENNLQINYENGLHKLSVSDKVSQAAPIQIDKIELFPNIKEDEYILQYFFEDKGKNNDKKPAFEIENLQINFRDRQIDSSCNPSYLESGSQTDEIIIRENDHLVMECNIVLEEKDSFTTKTFGSFNYEYKIRIEDNIKLPKDN
jgi:hypothetical protein